jgi:WhiB family redox-sensing transcriptional regulator
MPMASPLRDGRDRRWMENAACRDDDPRVYDTDDDPHPSRAIRCGACPVRTECLTYAFNGKESGTWGGMSRKEREKFIKARRRPTNKCPKCRGEDIYTNYGVSSCAPCGVSWEISPRRTRESRSRLNPAGV